MNVFPDPVAIWISARAVLGQGTLYVPDRLGLLAPQAALVQRRHGLQPATEGRHCGIFGDLPCPLGQRLRSVEREYPATAGLRVIAVGEPRLGPGGLVDERQRLASRLSADLLLQR